jgi:hypothetical protein
MIPVGIYEISIGFWLLIKGANLNAASPGAA